jgi:hypothetical protein
MNMMKESFCTYAGTRGDLLVTYLFNEMAMEERAGFDRHLASCAVCRAELEALRGVRSELKGWSAPEPSFHVTFDSARSRAGERGWSWARIPAWAQVAAAALFLGAGAGMANLEVSYGAAGLSVRTGWQHPGPARGTGVAAVGPAQASPWRADLTALEQRLRSDFRAQSTGATLAGAPELDAALRRVRALVEDSEQRQRRELGLRFAEMAREVEAQRQADLVRIDRSLGLISSRTGMEVMRTQQQVNSLAQRVSQRQ